VPFCLCYYYEIQNLIFLHDSSLIKIVLRVGFNSYPNGVYRSNQRCLSFDKLYKNSTSKRPLLALNLDFFLDENLCILKCLEVYLERTKDYPNPEGSLFLTLVSPFRRPRPNTIARHLKTVLQEAGIVDTAHSFRSAATSKAFQKGVSVADILKRATWANATTFEKHY
jgi:hypothetical protein